MSDFHGIIFAYGAVPELGELVRRRTASSLPRSLCIHLPL